MKKKVGILGGSFDPVHFGHLNLGLSLKEKCHLDEVLFVPAGLSPFKESAPPFASAKHRLSMLKIAIQPILGFRVLDWELDADGPSYTIDTIRRLSADPSLELHLLIGEDHLASLHKWKDAEELLELAPPLIGARNSMRAEAHIYKIPLFDISSTVVRERLIQKKYCGHLVPAKVLEYIEDHHLYAE